MSSSWLNDYLQTLHLNKESPSRKYLKRIIRAHVRTFAFENISKLLMADGPGKTESVSSVERFLDKHHKYQTGGTCFTLNSCLFQLLLALGFDGYLIRPGEEHMAVIIKDPESRSRLLYVDVGTTAPLFDPIPFHGRKHSIPPFAGERILFLPGGRQGLYTYIRTRNGQITDKKWTFSVYSKMDMDDFAPWIASTFQYNAMFMNMLRCQLWEPENRRGLSLVNRKFSIRHANGTVLTRYLPDKQALLHVLQEEFRMPDLPVTEAVDILERKGIDIFNK